MRAQNSVIGLNGDVVLLHVAIMDSKDEDDFVQLVLLAIVMAMLLKQSLVEQVNVRIITTGLNGPIVHEHAAVEVDLELVFVLLVILPIVGRLVHQWKMNVVLLMLAHHGDSGHNGTVAVSAVVLD